MCVLQRFSKCGVRPTGGAQRCDRWVANGRDERKIIIIIFFLNKLFGLQAGIEPGSSRAVVDCYSRRFATAVDFHSAAEPADAVPADAAL